MSNLKDQLIKLGSQNPDLRKHLRPIIAAVNVSLDDLNPRMSPREYDKVMSAMIPNMRQMSVFETSGNGEFSISDVAKKAKSITKDIIVNSAKKAGIPNPKIYKTHEWSANWGAYWEIRVNGARTDSKYASGNVTDPEHVQDPSIARAAQKFLDMWGYRGRELTGITWPIRGFLFTFYDQNGEVQRDSYKASDNSWSIKFDGWGA